MVGNGCKWFLISGRRIGISTVFKLLEWEGSSFSTWDGYDGGMQKGITHEVTYWKGNLNASQL